jgi:hypothetical protein
MEVLEALLECCQLFFFSALEPLSCFLIAAPPRVALGQESSDCQVLGCLWHNIPFQIDMLQDLCPFSAQAP